jgi:hypothetical protein
MTVARRLLLVAGLLGTLVGGTSFSGASFTSVSANPANRFSSAADWVAPAVTLADPGSPLRGTVTLTATASDTGGSGVASVAFQLRGPNQSTWTTACTDTTSPYSCSVDTTAYTDGTYDVRALATDNAGNTATSVVGSRAIDNAAFSVTLADPGPAIRGSVPLSATVSAGLNLVTSVRFQIRVSETTNWTDICTDLIAPYGCTLDTTKYAADLYDIRALATNALGSTATSEIPDVQIDNIAPTVTLADPGTMRGVVTLTTTAADADAGLDTVAIQRSPAGKATWTTICTATTDPYSCRFDTTAGATPDGSYDLRAIATDYAGNTKMSSVVTRSIDNTVVTVSLDDPGAYLRGTVTLVATPNATGGVSSTTIRRRPAGSSTWTTVCTKTASPWTCALDTTTLTDGLYDFQATMVAANGATASSAIVTDRRVDNSAMRGADVQAANRTGGALGKPESGDTLRLTWSEAPKASSLVPGWDGTGSTSLTVRLRDGNLVGTGGSADALDFQAAGGGALAALGSINLKGNYAKNNKTITFASTATLSGSTLTITLGAPAGGGPRTWGTPTTMVWTPSAAATDLAGNASSAAPVTESGTVDKDF